MAILNSLNAPIFPNFQPILMILESKFMVHRALSDKTSLSLGLLSPLSTGYFTWQKILAGQELMGIPCLQMYRVKPFRIYAML